MSQKVLIDSYPLSPMQQGMLFHHLKDPHSGVDIEQVVVHLPESIDVRRMQAAWQWLLNRHEILRARFVWEGVDQPAQEILPEVDLPFWLEDARRVPEQQQPEHLNAFLEADRLRAFEMDCAPMLRVALFQWADESFSLVWTFHHALLDGRCYPILLREAFEAYEELGRGGLAERRAPLSYRRYIDWLREQDFACAETFWKEMLSGFTAPTPLVVDRQVHSDKILYQQGEAWEKVDAQTTLQLRRLAKEQGLTVNSLVMGAWAILLHRYSNEEDIVFGSTRACRKSSISGADETIGLFINTVPVRVPLTGDTTILSVLQNVRKRWVEMRPYEHTPLARVKSVSQVPPGQPLFETLLVFENYRLDAAMRSLGGAWTKRRVELHELTNFPITLAAYDGEELSFKIEFDRRRLDDDAVRRMLGHLRCLLCGVATNPQALVRDLPLLTEQERRELIEEFSAQAQSPRSRFLPLDGGATLHKLFEAQVERRPNAVALTCDGRSLTYADLNAEANRVARELVELGVKPDMLVGLCLERANELVIALLAILKAGAAYLPIDLAYPADRLAFMLEDANAPVLLTQISLAGKLPPTLAKVLCVDEVLARPSAAEELENLPTEAGPDDLAYVIYTSGTTGEPKGTQITHRNVVRLLSNTEHWYGFNENDVWTLFHSTAFDFSVWEIWGALLYGGRVVVVPFLVSRSPEAFYELLANEKVTVLNQTPSAFRQLIQAEETVGQKELALRYVIFGGEALEMQTLRTWYERHGDQKPKLVNMYGITETTVHVTYRPLSKEDLSSGSVIGVPIPDLQIYILDQQLQPVPIGVPGEMYVGGAGLARGYLQRPELTSQRFIPDHLTGRPGSRLYKTGDLARFLPGHDIEYLGRIDHQVKIRGFRIELGEIESVLCQHPAIRQALVLVREDAPGSKRIVAYVMTPSPAPEVSALREHLKKKLPEYMVPAAFVFLEKFPLTNNGKIDPKALPLPEQQRPELAARYVPPRTPAEKTLAAIWSKVLRVERVGVNDNFFELGGDSILSIQIISLGRSEGLKLTPKLLFSHQTIAELAAVAGVAEQAQCREEVVAGDVPLTPIQHWFFEQGLSESHYYNQAFLFELDEQLDQSLLESALKKLSQQHDALRLRYVHTAEGWRQSYSESEAPAPSSWTDLSHFSEAEQRRKIESAAASMQGSLDIQNGPLWRVAYFDLGTGLPHRLLIVVHHLAMDGISWRPLLEDLETVYQQLKSAKKPQLPAKTTSFKAWAEKLHAFARRDRLREELPYWMRVTGRSLADSATMPNATAGSGADNTEASTETVKVSLTAAETQALLQQVPAAYNTQVNDVLLTALARAWNRWTGSSALFANLEGHGRENLFEDVDLSRTLGWFTSIFPLLLQLPDAKDNWRPGEALKSIKEQIREIPRRGIGYGILRYLVPDSALAKQPEPSVVFNYLGQFDQVVAGSKLFRFASESTGPWHSPAQRRRHALELNSLVIDGRLELWWTYSRNLHSETAIANLADEFLRALRELVAHCLSSEAGGRTPSDFPLAHLDQPTLDSLIVGRRGIEDIYPLSPIQTLFYSANPGVTQVTFDQWHCTLRGELDVPAFQRGWQEVLQRHSILRTTIHGDRLREPVQIVHRNAEMPWNMEDWRPCPMAEHADRWLAYLRADLACPLNLTEAPAMRAALVRLTDDTWKFAWSVPALLLDGWSWPLVFRDVSRLYGAFTQGAAGQLEPVRPYRDYLEWLSNQSAGEAQKFWKQNLAEFREPTVVPSEPPESDGPGERYVELPLTLSAETTNSLQSAARLLQVTLNTLVQSAWALLVSQQSGSTDVVFGAAFNGRPTDLHGVESIVGPFVNNLPVRISMDARATGAEFVRSVHARLLELSPYQFTPLMEIQNASEVPWRHRLFESLIVFQNYLVDESARRLGEKIGIEEFVGPIHTNYPVMLLAEPGTQLRLTLIYDRQTIARATAEEWGRDLTILLEHLPVSLENSCTDLQAMLSRPRGAASRPKRKLFTQSQNFVPPQTEMEQTIAAVWQKMFGLDQVGVEDNFFELGGHSMLLVQLHDRLKDALKTEFPIVTLFAHPTIRSLAQRLGQPAKSSAKTKEQLRDRAQRQQEALAKLRVTLKK
jgi:amino acid adenylation domain-containing protein/non-ribosomal peptide synthase protein (TIGR01720 family)